MRNLLPIATLVAVALTPAAAHAKATDTGRHGVSKQVYVYVKPGVGFSGTAMKGWTFDVKRLSPSGKWAYGRAFGQINRDVWIKASALTER